MTETTIGVLASLRRPQWRRSLPALALTAACGLSQQTPAAQSSVAASSSNSDELQEVVVTAERRATDVQSTPIDLTALSGSQLEEQQIRTITDMQVEVPSFQVNNGGLFQSINIRGVGNSVINPSIATGVAVFRDGLFEPETIGLSEPFYDIADTEVLKGPQGTFIGQSSTGGALLINSVNPNFDGVSGFI